MKSELEIVGYVGEKEKIKNIEKSVHKAAEHWMMPGPIKSARITKRVKICITIVESEE
jgi:hypothetical protein